MCGGGVARGRLIVIIGTGGIGGVVGVCGIGGGVGVG